MLFQTDLCGCDQSVGDGQHPGFPVAMPTTIDGNGFQAGIDGGKMGAGADAGLAQNGGGKQPAEPRRMLQDRKLVPGIEGDDRLQHRRQVFGLAQHSTPFLQPRILVPVEIIDQCVSIRRATAAGPSCVLDRGLRSGEHRIDGGIVDTGKILAKVSVFLLPVRLNLDPALGSHALGLVGVDRRNLRGLSQCTKSVGGKRPAGWLGGDAPTRAQDVVGDCQLMVGCVNISGIVVVDESPSMHSEAQASVNWDRSIHP